MGKIAFLFPGQGAQHVGMGRAAYETSEVARETFESADRTLGASITALCFEGPADELQLTSNTQPALLTVSTALFRAFGERCDMSAGHSLGEYSAHVAAGTLAFEDALAIVRARGTYMQQAVPVGAGAMAAILGLGNDIVEQVCRDARTNGAGVVEPVNYNSPGQVVIAGEAQAVTRACEELKGKGGKAIPLPVSAPFHSSLMQPAEAKLEPHLRAASFSDPSWPVYTNVDAAPVRFGAEARDALIRQVSRPVRWEETIRAMLEAGATLFVEIGAGKVLTGLTGRIDKQAVKISVQSPADFDAARAVMAEHR